jgi:orotidine-5'-phosphate decarboxylase
MGFVERLMTSIHRAGNSICVGVDPRPEDLPAGFLDRFSEDRIGVADALRVFSLGVIDVVAPVAPAVKFQAAFYESYGPEGLAALRTSMEYAQQKGLVVLFDGKRNDIGTTAEAYARAYLGKVPAGRQYESSWPADALTINPYFGSDGVAPFLKVAAREAKGVFVLVRTSNMSAQEFQDLVTKDGRPVYRHVAERLAQWAEPYRDASGYSLAGAVVGATYPDQLAELRAALPGVFFLVPGYGAQGGSAADVAAAFDENGLGALINNSRGLTFAYTRPAFARFGANWQDAIAESVREMVEDLALHTPSARLRTAL